jgi:hypothetical protein
MEARGGEGGGHAIGANPERWQGVRRGGEAATQRAARSRDAGSSDSIPLKNWVRESSTKLPLSTNN